MDVNSVNFSPSPPSFLGNGAPIPAAMFNPDHPSPDDGGSDPKRRRIARACDMCRKKKVRMSYFVFATIRLVWGRNLRQLKLICLSADQM